MRAVWPALTRLVPGAARVAQEEVFEEIATAEFAFEGIPTVPPRKDMEHFAFFCDGCRYRCARSAVLSAVPSAHAVDAGCAA